LDIATNDKGVFGFGPFLLDPVRRRLTLDGEVVKLPPTQFDTLLYLVQNPGRVVEKDELLAAVWGGRIIEESNLSQAIYLLRRALGRGEGGDGYIVTAPGRGYRFAGEVQRIYEPEAAQEKRLPSEPSFDDDASMVAPAPAITSAKKRWLGVAVLTALGAAALTVAVLGATALRRPEPLQPGPVFTQPATAFHPPEHSVAVLAFNNMSGDPKQEYFSDGLSEELIDVLGRIGTLRVPARLSAFSFKGKSATVGDIARQLNVGAVLEGSVRRDGSRLRITAQLIDAKTGYQLWSQSYDRDQGDILKIQGDIAAAVARGLQVSLLDGSSANLEVGGTANPHAFDAYLRGMKLSFAGEYAAAGQAALFKSALSAFTEAIDIDPNYAKGHLRRALALMLLIGSDETPNVDGLARMETAAQDEVERAISLAPELPDAHALLGVALVWFRSDFVRGLQEVERARALGPNNREANLDYADLQSDVGHSREALAAAELAASLDPLTPRTYLRLAENQESARLFAEAQATLRRGELLETAPSLDDIDEQGRLELLQGQYAAARQTCAAALDSQQMECLAIAEHALGNEKAASSWLAKLRNKLGDAGVMFYAEIYAQWKQAEDAVHWLAEAYRLHDNGMPEMKADALLDPIRETAGYQDIERRMHFPP
jgi:serine/threonine-protein kinase